MTPVYHDSPTAIREALEAMGISLKKRWGQNFLINPGARSKMLSALGALPGDSVWEIGPGLGAMTGSILSAGSRVTAFEIDRGLCRFLKEIYAPCGGFTLVEGDFLKTWKAAYGEGSPRRVFGNLPYSSASLMIASLAEAGVRPDIMLFTVQKELGERILADPGTKAYSAFSVLCQACFNSSLLGILKPGSFYPAPEVDSSIVRMSPREEREGAVDRGMLSALARMFFSSRRKTIRNNIKEGGISPRLSREPILDAMTAEGLDPGRRAEELSPEDYIRLAVRLARLK